MKRQTLERNLKRVISRVEEGIAPLRIAEVWGFGSFFRLKAEPRDIDLTIFYKKDPEFDRKVDVFTRIVQHWNKKEEDRTMLEAFVTNQPWTKGYTMKSLPGIPADVWLRYTKVSGPMRTYSGLYRFNSIDITPKMLREGIRGIQISEIEDIQNKDKYFSRVRAQSFRLVWSEDERDVDKNLQQSNEEQITLILIEMKNFAFQVERYKSYYCVLTNVLKLVVESIQSHKSIPDKEQLAERVRIVGSERGILEPYLKWMLTQITGLGYDEEPIEDQVTNLDIDNEINQIEKSVKDVSELGLLCESMREDIDEFRSRCGFANRLLNLLIDSDNYYVPPIEERVSRFVHWALRAVPMYEAKDDVKRRVLADLGLDEISRNIVLVEILGHKSEYYLADSEEDFQRLIDRSKKGRTEKEHAKYIRPILRKVFPKSTETSVYFSTVIGENGVAIPQKVHLDAFSRGQEIDKMFHLAKKLGFAVDVSVLWGDDICNAKRDIDISHLNGDRKRIKKLVKSALHIQQSGR